MELDSVEGLFFVLHGGMRAGICCGECYEIVVGFLDLVSVACPCGDRIGQVCEEVGFIGDFQCSSAVFAFFGGCDFCSEGAACELHSVADAEYWYAEVEDFGIALWGVFVVDACGPAGEYYAADADFREASGFYVGAADKGEDVVLADSASY